MRLVLAISTVLGLIGVVSAFGLFYLGERVFHFDRLHVQTLMYLKLSVAGHLTIFLTRTRGPFWSIRPARILWIAVLGTQTIATLLAVFGVFMAPLGWKWAGFVWGYALVWALVNDRVKLLAYKIFDPVKAEAKPDAKGEPKPEAKAESKPEAKTPSDLTPQITRATFLDLATSGRRISFGICARPEGPPGRGNDLAFFSSLAGASTPGRMAYWQFALAALQPFPVSGPKTGEQPS
jgi:hypothetical protein